MRSNFLQNGQEDLEIDQGHEIPDFKFYFHFSISILTLMFIIAECASRAVPVFVPCVYYLKVKE